MKSYFKLTFLNNLFTAYKFYQKSDSGTSRKLFRFSLIHLPLLMLLFLFNKKHWFLNSQTTPSVAESTIEATNDTILEQSVKGGLEMNSLSKYLPSELVTRSQKEVLK